MTPSLTTFGGTFLPSERILVQCAVVKTNFGDIKEPAHAQLILSSFVQPIAAMWENSFNSARVLSVVSEYTS